MVGIVGMNEGLLNQGAAPDTYTRDALEAPGHRGRLRLMRFGEERGRPVRCLTDAVARWHGPFRASGWKVETGWLDGLAIERGCDAALILFSAERVARVAVDAALPDDAAELAVMRALVQLELTVLRGQIRRASESIERRVHRGHRLHREQRQRAADRWTSETPPPLDPAHA